MLLEMESENPLPHYKTKSSGFWVQRFKKKAVRATLNPEPLNP
jgi:hypothetical protein